MDTLDSDRILRLQADLANLRRHQDDTVRRARMEARIEGLTVVAGVADDLRRAIDSAPESEGPWRDGLQGLLHKVEVHLAQAGVVPLGAPGEAFDPHVHEAVGRGLGPAGTVVAVAESGLALQDGTLLRPARVVVAA